MKPNARFWIWWNEGWVRITLRPDEDIHLAAGGPTEEGWWRQGERYWYDDIEDRVVCELTSEGSDCDGRLDHYWDGYCPITELAAVEEEVIMGDWCPARPDWQKLSASQRDYAAEAMGY